MKGWLVKLLPSDIECRLDDVQDSINGYHCIFYHIAKMPSEKGVIVLNREEWKTFNQFKETPLTILPPCETKETSIILLQDSAINLDELIGKKVNVINSSPSPMGDGICYSNLDWTITKVSQDNEYYYLYDKSYDFAKLKAEDFEFFLLGKKITYTVNSDKSSYKLII